jgi:hypothetical protein
MCDARSFAQQRAPHVWEPWVWAWLTLIVAGGCGGQGLVPVSGKITHKDGTPVTSGMVIFEPEAHKNSARGEIKADGTFQLGTNTNNDGALEGDYKVLIAPQPLPEEGKRVRSPIGAKYQSLETTPLKCTVGKDARKNRFEIVVE